MSAARRAQNQTRPGAPGNRGAIGIEEGWQLFIDDGKRPGFLLGHAPGTTKRYRSMQQRTTAFLLEREVKWWHQLREEHLVDYGKAFDGQLSPRTIHPEITMLISVSNWLIRHKRLSSEAKLHLRLRKPEGPESYC